MKNILLLLYTILLGNTLHAQQQGIINNTDSKFVQLKSIDIGECKWTDGFWADKFKICEQSMVPYMEKVVNNKYRFERKIIVDSFSYQDLIYLFKSQGFSELFPERKICNLYLDDLNYSSYFDNVLGNSNRLKHRIRWYGELFGIHDKFTLEQKIKKGNVGIKNNFVVEKNLTNKVLAQDIQIKIIPKSRAISSFQSKLSITPINKNSSVLNLSFKDVNINKAEDFLNGLVEQYNLDAINDKNEVSRKTKDFIVVGIHNIQAERWQDLFPQKAFDYLLEEDKTIINQQKSHIKGGAKLNGDNYLKFLIGELKPIVNSEFSTCKNKENTFVMGSSMGGLMSMYAICEYPEVFGGAACLSTHWPGANPIENNPLPKAIFKYMEVNFPIVETHKIYFDYGTETLDAHYPKYAPTVTQVLMLKGYSESNFKNLEFEGTDHSENSWNKRLDIPLTFLLQKN